MCAASESPWARLRVLDSGCCRSVKRGSGTSIAQLTERRGLDTLPFMQQRLPTLKEMERVLSEMPEVDREPFLAWLEHRARDRDDLEVLRVIRDYRKSLQSTTPRQP